MDECGISGILYTQDTLSGIIEGEGSIHGTVEAKGVLVGEVGFPQCHSPAVYHGEYEVTPRSYEQSLATADKLMEDDVTVREIPYYETSNEYGTTIFISGDINYG